MSLLRAPSIAPIIPAYDAAVRKVLALIPVVLAVAVCMAGAAFAQKPDLRSFTKLRVTGGILAPPEFEAFFQDAGTTGTIAILNFLESSVWLHNVQRAHEKFPPASTFKFYSSLVALQTGVVTDIDTQIFKWDGIERGRAAWDKDHTLRSAFSASALHVYQNIVRDIGVRGMNNYLETSQYGTGKATPENIETFWITDALTTSTWDQLYFLKRLYMANDLPFTDRTIEQVKDISFIERDDDYILFGKTGLTTAVEPSMGWFVGWVVRRDNTYIFALNLDVTEPEHVEARISITKNILRSLGIL